LEDQEIGCNQNDHANQAYDPMHAMSRRPAKHKVSCWQKNNAKKCGHETMFWGSETVFLDVWDEVFELVDEEAGDAD
jgi:hypothetical protein